MTSRFFFACGPHYCHLAELHYRKRANETQESRKDRERETGRERDSPHQMEGEFNLHLLGGVEGLSSPPVSSPSDFSELLPQRAQSAAPFRFRGFLFFFVFLLQRRLITAQSDARLIEPEGGRIKSRTCCSCQLKKRKEKKTVMHSESEKKVALDTRF